MSLWIPPAEGGTHKSRGPEKSQYLGVIELFVCVMTCARRDDLIVFQLAAANGRFSNLSQRCHPLFVSHLLKGPAGCPKELEPFSLLPARSAMTSHPAERVQALASLGMQRMSRARSFALAARSSIKPYVQSCLCLG